MQIGFLIAAIVINLSLTLVVFTRSQRASSTGYFALSSLFIVLWAAGTLGMLYGPSIPLAYLGLTFFLISPMLTALFMLLFAKHITEIDFPAHHIGTIAYGALTVICACFVVASLDANIVTVVPGGENLINFQHPWFYVYGVFFVLTFFASYLYLFFGLLKRKGRQRMQLVYVAAGVSATSFLALITNVILPLFGNSTLLWLGPTWTLIYIITTCFSMARYRLFDLRQALVLTFTYVLSLIALATIYFVLALTVSELLFPAGKFSTGSSLVNVALAILLAFLFQPIRHFFDQLTNRFFYQGEYDSDEFYARLSDTLSSTTDARQLLRRASDQIGQTLKATQAFFFVYNPTGHVIQAGGANQSKLPTPDARWLDSWVAQKGVEPIDLALLEDDNKAMRRFMISHRVAVILPLQKQEGEIVGYLCLGEHRKGGYTARDLRVLSAISNELVIAIENALSIQEVRALNTTLQQRINEATKELRASNAQLQRLDEAKDEFISMASHQLRTPLTSVKGYISMVVEGDAGKVTDAQKHLLDEAFFSSERMVRLINDFLNVSRLQTGKFILDKRPSDLITIVQQEIDSLESSAQAHGIKFSLKLPRKLPTLNLDDNKMRQVIMNFADNAIYYSKENSTIQVTLKLESTDILFTVKDRGIGVPAGEQTELFQKFFRATNARKQRPDGTGIGLFLAKKVIDAHQGQVVFESKEGRGSTFGFRLPLSRVGVNDPKS